MKDDQTDQPSPFGGAILVRVCHGDHGQLPPRGAQGTELRNLRNNNSQERQQSVAAASSASNQNQPNAELVYPADQEGITKLQQPRKRLEKEWPKQSNGGDVAMTFEQYNKFLEDKTYTEEPETTEGDRMSSFSAQELTTGVGGQSSAIGSIPSNSIARSGTF